MSAVPASPAVSLRTPRFWSRKVGAQQHNCPAAEPRTCIGRIAHVRHLQEALFEAQFPVVQAIDDISRNERAPQGMVEELIRQGISPRQIATHCGSSHLAVTKWLDGTGQPGEKEIVLLLDALKHGRVKKSGPKEFQSHGSKYRLADYPDTAIAFEAAPLASPLSRISSDDEIRVAGSVTLSETLARRAVVAPTASSPTPAGISAGKNTYTYDAHTYHTKVPPQGIAELLRYYLPEGGLVADPFAGSGMTGVAASIAGMDCVLNELSPAAAFIASRFTSKISPAKFSAAVKAVVKDLEDVRRSLYTTDCRECSQPTELLYTTWAYRVLCPYCDCEFQLWDVARSYGKTVREHKILREFPCPECSETLQKSRLSRTVAEPVQIGYKCCSKGRQETTATPNVKDLAIIESSAALSQAADDLIPRNKFPHGVNLRQPIKHGIDSVDAIYTSRNLAALSRIWERTLSISDPQLAAQVAFVFTSLYRRVSKFSEFRFWGGSGNAARLNVPFIYDESNVFISYLRKAQTILDHLQTAAPNFSGSVAVTVGSATDLRSMPDESVDLVFTDPPFGSNINYSDMNFIWEAWLGRFTDTKQEAIVNKVQGKSLDDYQALMTESFSESYRILRDKHWMLVVFMNSSAAVWEAINRSIRQAGFRLVKADIFDKQHGTVKEFESANTAGSDMIIHCFKDTESKPSDEQYMPVSPTEFALSVDLAEYRQRFLHVAREEEFNYRRLYSEWLGQCLVRGGTPLDFIEFKAAVRPLVEG